MALSVASDPPSCSMTSREGLSRFLRTRSVRARGSMVSFGVCNSPGKSGSVSGSVPGRLRLRVAMFPTPSRGGGSPLASKPVWATITSPPVSVVSAAASPGSICSASVLVSVALFAISAFSAIFPSPLEARLQWGGKDRLRGWRVRPLSEVLRDRAPQVRGFRFGKEGFRQGGHKRRNLVRFGNGIFRRLGVRLWTDGRRHQRRLAGPGNDRSGLGLNLGFENGYLEIAFQLIRDQGNGGLGYLGFLGHTLEGKLLLGKRIDANCNFRFLRFPPAVNSLVIIQIIMRKRMTR